MQNGREKERIVVIDAEPVVRDVVSTILERVGYEVTATDDFEQAIQIIRSQAPRLVLTNIYLKGITGHDAMQRLKTEFPAVPVLMVSGLPDDKAIQNWIAEDGFDAFPKPFTPGALVTKVREMLHRP